MAKPRFILAIDQGTTSTRAILFDLNAEPQATAQQELPQIYPADGWVEHDAEEIWRATVAVVKAALEKAHAEAADVAAVGITNQRETTVVWDRASGKPIHNAIVWQDRRTTAFCKELVAAGHGNAGAEEDGAADRSLFLRDQGGVAAGQCGGGAERGGGRQAGVRDDRLLSAVAADGREGACDGCDECLAHDAVQYPYAELGSRSCWRS